MNKFLIFGLILVVSLDFALAYTYIVPGAMGKSKEKENYCYYKDTDTHIKRGKTITTQNCEEVSCWKDYTIQINGCGTYSIDDPSCLKWDRDFSKPYPDCCMAFICVEHSKDYLNLDEDHLNTNQL